MILGGAALPALRQAAQRKRGFNRRGTSEAKASIIKAESYRSAGALRHPKAILPSVRLNLSRLAEILAALL
jgi:hypothetical protein